LTFPTFSDTFISGTSGSVVSDVKVLVALSAFSAEVGVPDLLTGTPDKTQPEILPLVSAWRRPRLFYFSRLRSGFFMPDHICASFAGLLKEPGKSTM
jgi:hypothetical protein